MRIGRGFDIQHKPECSFLPTSFCCSDKETFTTATMSNLFSLKPAGQSYDSYDIHIRLFIIHSFITYSDTITQYMWSFAMTIGKKWKSTFDEFIRVIYLLTMSIYKYFAIRHVGELFCSR